MITFLLVMLLVNSIAMHWRHSRALAREKRWRQDLQADMRQMVTDVDALLTEVSIRLQGEHRRSLDQRIALLQQLTDQKGAADVAPAPPQPSSPAQADSGPPLSDARVRYQEALLLLNGGLSLNEVSRRTGLPRGELELAQSLYGRIDLPGAP